MLVKEIIIIITKNNRKKRGVFFACEEMGFLFYFV